MHEMGLRERKKSETRQAISAAALELATTNGPGDVTVEDIAAAANVSPRTVFNYFPTKEAAILGLDPERRGELVERLAGRPAGEAPLAAVQATFREFFTHEVAMLWRRRAQLAREHAQLHRAYLQSWAGLEDDLTDALARRIGIEHEDDPYPRLVVAVAATAMRVAVGHALDERHGVAIGDSVDEAFAAIAAGLPAPRRTAPRKHL